MPVVNVADDNDDNDDNLLVFNDVNFGVHHHLNSVTRELMIKDEIDSYLRAKLEPDVKKGLQNYPVIRSIFKKYNCIRSSEAICEREFSYAGNLVNFLCDIHVFVFLVNGFLCISIWAGHKGFRYLTGLQMFLIFNN